VARESLYVATFDVEADHHPSSPKNHLWHDAMGPVFMDRESALSAIKSPRPSTGKENHAYEVQVTMYDIHSSVEYLLIGFEK
jgi:hypothetical protein